MTAHPSARLRSSCYIAAHADTNLGGRGAPACGRVGRESQICSTSPFRRSGASLDIIKVVARDQSGGSSAAATAPAGGMTAIAKMRVTLPARSVPSAVICRRRSADRPRATAIEPIVTIGHKTFALDDHCLVCESLPIRWPDLEAVPDLPPCLTDVSCPSELPGCCGDLAEGGFESYFRVRSRRLRRLGEWLSSATIEATIQGHNRRTRWEGPGEGPGGWNGPGEAPGGLPKSG